MHSCSQLCGVHRLANLQNERHLRQHDVSKAEWHTHVVDELVEPGHLHAQLLARLIVVVEASLARVG